MFQSLSDKQLAAHLDTAEKERTRSRSPRKGGVRAGNRKGKSPATRQRSGKSKKSLVSLSKSPPQELKDPALASPMLSPVHRKVDFGPSIDEDASLKAQVSLGALKGRNERRRSGKGSTSRSRSGRRGKGTKGSNTATRGGAQCEVQTQTDLRGVEHRILVRAKGSVPDSAEVELSSMGKIQRDKTAKIEIEDNRSRAEGMGGLSGGQGTYTDYLGENKPPQHVDQEPVVVPGQPSGNNQAEQSQDLLVQPHPLYRANEIEVVLDQIKNSYKDFKRTDIMKPFYLKALGTLRKLLEYLGKQETYKRVCYEYKEITLENTIKLLLRCRLAYGKIKSEREQAEAIGSER